MGDILALIEPLIPALRRYARGLVRDPVAADDLVQDCLEKVIANWHQRRNADPRTWAFTILHNVAVNGMRQRARRGAHFPVEDAQEAALAHRAGQEDGLVRQDILDAIGRLPDEQRSVILLVSIEDMTYAQVAAVLAVPIGTVMSRLSRGRERLRQMLDQPEKAVAEQATHLRRVK